MALTVAVAVAVTVAVAVAVTVSVNECDMTEIVRCKIEIYNLKAQMTSVSCPLSWPMVSGNQTTANKSESILVIRNGDRGRIAFGNPTKPFLLTESKWTNDNCLPTAPGLIGSLNKRCGL